MLQQLSQFRSDLYQALPKRADALLDLFDALASTPSARSVVELSLSALFRRSFSSVYDAVDSLFEASSAEKAGAERLEFQKKRMNLSLPYLSKPVNGKFLLFGVDCVSIPRLYAPTLEDRGFVHQPTVIRGNKPITIGHSYSLFAALPEPEEGDYSHWIFPLSIQRVASHQKATEVAQEQMRLIFDQFKQGFDVSRESAPKDRGQLCVSVADTAYSTPEHLCSNHEHENFVTIARMRSNRTLYWPYREELNGQQNRRGHPRWYGEEARLQDDSLWQTPDETTTVSWKTKRGKEYTVTISAINDLRMRGKRTSPMHDKPNRLVRIVVTDEAGNAVYKKPLYLTACGERRNELTLQEIYDAFKARFDLEHFFRFGKQRLLLAKAQTPDIQTEENWCNVSVLAYQLLFLARKVAKEVRRPWERKPEDDKEQKGVAKSPTEVQRDFERIIREIGTPAEPPKPRNKPKGRPKGFKPKPRMLYQVVKKTRKQP